MNQCDNIIKSQNKIFNCENNYELEAQTKYNLDESKLFIFKFNNYKRINKILIFNFKRLSEKTAFFYCLSIVICNKKRILLY